MLGSMIDLRDDSEYQCGHHRKFPTGLEVSPIVHRRGIEPVTITDVIATITGVSAKQQCQVNGPISNTLAFIVKEAQAVPHGHSKVAEAQSVDQRDDCV